ncbi:hypothetical protein GDO81_014371 [Engystomops pustulosus]|uniref:Uncharacterized protein n=1 Tax=Engystomops pustulosus TaxID=76066 RepID=A0AAV7BA08_ENGPU|nr:hypothetical protein GDO81_014371 [Engystomops pustulosus]
MNTWILVTAESKRHAQAQTALIKCSALFLPAGGSITITIFSPNIQKFAQKFLQTEFVESRRSYILVRITYITDLCISTHL